MQQIDFKIKCRVVSLQTEELTEEEIEEEMLELENLLKENGYKGIDVSVE